MRSVTYHNMTFDEFLTPKDIEGIVEHVASRINANYEGKSPLFICALNGAFVYAADLFRRIKLPADITFVRLKSYDGTSSTGEVELITPLYEPVQGRDVIIIEDIVDSGLTMHIFRQMLLDAGAESVALTAFLFKPEALQYEDARPEYIGREIPNKFIIGYGLDLDDQARNLDAVYQLRGE